MFQTATFFKIGGTLLAVGGFAGVASKAANNYVNIRTELIQPVIPVNETGNDYLIVKAKYIEENAKKLISGKNRNYNCLISDEGKEIGCLITEIVFGDKKSVDITTVNSLSFDSSKDIKIFQESKKDKYFKVQLEKDVMQSFDIKTTNALTAYKLNAGKFVEFTPELKIVNGKVESKNNIVLAISKASSTTDATDTFANYKCTMSTEITEATNCKVYKFATPPEESTTLESVDFSTNVLSAVAQDTDIQDQKMHIIELINPKITGTVADWKDKTIDFKPYTSGTVATGKKTYTFTVKGRLFGDLTKSKDGVFIIEK